MVRARILIIAFAGLTLTGTVRADMMPVGGPEAGARPSATVDAATEGQGGPCDLPGFYRVADLNTFPLGSLPSTPKDAASVPPLDTQSCPILTDGLDSFSLCLYALMGLGVFRSGHYIRRCSFSFIPEWYHSGAPQQIGHSHAVGPDAFCHAAACFVQPDAAPDRLMPLYRAGTTPILVHTSPCISDVLASRAPPSLS